MADPPQRCSAPDRLPTASHPPGGGPLLAHARDSRSARHLLECLLGRPVVVRTVRRHSVTTTDRDGFTALAAKGVLLGRDLLLADSLPPHRALAMSASLVVPRRLPRRVLTALVTGSVPLDRLLDACGVRWEAEVLDAEIVPAAEASFPVGAPSYASLVRMTRRLSVPSGPVAMVVDEVACPRTRSRRLGLVTGPDAAHPTAPVTEPVVPCAV